MAESVQITPIITRAIVRLKSWAAPPTPAQRGGEESLYLLGSDLTAKRSATPHPTQAEEESYPLSGESFGGGVSLIPPGLGGQANLLHLGPGEWLVVSDALDGWKLHARLTHHLERHSIAPVDLSCALKALRVEGPYARELLSKGCGLDLYPSSFPAGRSTRTRFAQLSVILHCTDPAPRFELYASRSYLTYLQSWLLDSAAEFIAVCSISQA